MPTERAIARAREQGLDLIEVAPQAQPPVCRIANFGKWQYEQNKKNREERQQGKHRQSETKGVRITMRASTHDLAFRARQADEFLKDGHKVRIEVFLRGREKARPQLARDRIRGFLDLLIVPWKIEQEARPGGKGVEAVIVKDKKQPTVAKTPDQQEKEEPASKPPEDQPKTNE